MRSQTSLQVTPGTPLQVYKSIKCEKLSIFHMKPFIVIYGMSQLKL